MAQKAEVKYDPEYILPSQIANAINDLGFSATVVEQEGDGQGVVELTVSPSREKLHFLMFMNMFYTVLKIVMKLFCG